MTRIHHGSMGYVSGAESTIHLPRNVLSSKDWVVRYNKFYTACETMPHATINGHRLHYVDTQSFGSDIENTKLPIVLIHGLGSSQNYYMPVLDELRKFRCIALSTYGAASSKSQGESLTLEGLAEDVIGLMDKLGIVQAVVVGHSMGGTMACQIAAAHPHRVSGIVCIGPVNPDSVKPDIFKSRIDTVLKDGMEPLADSIPITATSAQSTALQRAMIRELLLNQEPRSYASHCRVIVDMRDPGFGAIKCPALILAGDEDKSAPLEGCKYIFDNLGSESKDLKIMPGVGHWHCIEAGEDVGREIAAFASRVW